MRFLQLIGVILGILYFQQDYDQEGVQNINGGIFLILTNMTFANVNAVINVFCNELPILLREHYKGMYRVDVYYICKQIAEVPVYLFTPVLFNAIFYWMVGLNSDAARFFMSCGVILLMVQVVVSFGTT